MMSAFGTKRTCFVRCTCPLLGVKRTCHFALHMSAYDPKRTLAKIGLRLRYVWCPLSRDARFLSDQGCPEMQG